MVNKSAILDFAVTTQLLNIKSQVTDVRVQNM